jgi:hypothetical protein
MLIEFHKKLEKSKWLRWVGIAPLVIFPMIYQFNVKMWQGIGLLIFLGNMWAGVTLGRIFGRFLNKHLLKQSSELGQRLDAGFADFGFLFLPPLAASWTNTYLNTGIKLHNLGTHFLWACVGGGIFFCVKPSASKS